MKKTALLIMVTTIMAISLGSLAEKEITFRNIEWFSTREEVKSALLTDGAKIQGPWDLDSLGAARIVRDGPDDLSVNIYYDYGFADYYEGRPIVEIHRTCHRPCCHSGWFFHLRSRRRRYTADPSEPGLP